MRLSGVLLAVLVLAGCDGGQQEPEVSDAASVVMDDSPARSDCTGIVSAVERLACFDQLAGTPVAEMEKPPVETGQDTAPAIQPAPTITSLVRSNEEQRTTEDSRFLLSSDQDELGQAQIIISAPAVGSIAPRPYLAISCLANITRLQLLTTKTIERNHVSMQLFLDDRPLSAPSTWQVLEVGNIVDAGRGLIAIDQLKRIENGSRLRLQSNYPPFDGLIFDAQGLKSLIAQQREACHW